MKKPILSFLFALISLSTVLAQSITLSPTTMEVSGSAASFETIAHSSVTNNTNSMLVLTWERIENSLPVPQWKSLICDTNSCWGPTTNKKSFNLPAGKSAKIDVHFQPNGIGGSGLVKVAIYAAADSANINIVGTYTAVLSPVTATTTAANSRDTKLYPNPARSVVNVDFPANKDISLIEVYNVIGKKIAAYYLEDYQDTYPIPVADLDAGLYFVVLYNNRSQSVSSKVFSKID